MQRKWLQIRFSNSSVRKCSFYPLWKWKNLVAYDKHGGLAFVYHERSKSSCLVNEAKFEFHKKEGPSAQIISFDLEKSNLNNFIPNFILMKSTLIGLSLEDLCIQEL